MSTAMAGMAIRAASQTFMIDEDPIDKDSDKDGKIKCEMVKL